eukprot:COSAG02_NODE_4310_length_5526_cov_2.555187_6_plen_55_part_00
MFDTTGVSAVQTCTAEVGARYADQMLDTAGASAVQECTAGVSARCCKCTPLDLT